MKNLITILIFISQIFSFSECRSTATHPPLDPSIPITYFINLKSICLKILFTVPLKSHYFVKNPDKVKRYLMNFDIVEKKLEIVEENDKIKNFQPPVTGEEIIDIFAMFRIIFVFLVSINCMIW